MATATIISKYPSAGGGGALGLTATLPNGETTVAYVGYLDAVGGTTPYTFSISSGSLPSGLSLNASTGEINGTPTATGTFGFTGKVVDAAANVATVVVSIAITSLSVAFVGSTQPVGIPVSGCSLVATSGSGGYTYSITGTLPGWLTFNNSTGLFSGTPPTANLTYSFTGNAADSAGATTTVSCTLTISNALTVQITGFGEVGVSFSGGFSAYGGNTPYTFSVSSGSLPSWATLNSSTGAITGTPTASGFTFFTAKVTDAVGNTATAEGFISISINFSGVPSGTLGVGFSGTTASYGTPYTGFLVASLGAGGYVFSISVGTLPAGLSLNSATGEIYGTPSAVEVVTFTAKVTDSASNTATASCTINVSAATSARGTTIGAEVPNCTPLNFTAQLVPGATIDGVVQFQAVLENVVSPDSVYYSGGPQPTFWYADVMLQPVVTVGTTFASTGSSQSINISPYASASAYNGFNDPSVSGSIPCIFQIDAEQFLLTVKGGGGAWTVTGAQNGTSAATHTAGALVVGLHGCSGFVIGVVQDANGVDYPCGFQNYPPLQTSSAGITDTYGTISFILYLVSVAQGTILNTFPVSGVTPYAGPFTLDYPAGALNGARISPLTIGPGLTVNNNLQSATLNNSNLISNPGAELLPLGNNWTLPTGASVDTQFVHSGSYAFKLTSGGSEVTIQPSVHFPVTPGDSYVVSVWAGEYALSSTASFQIAFYDNTNTLVNFATVTPGSGGYPALPALPLSGPYSFTQYVFMGTAGPGAVSGVVFGNLNGTGNIWVDDWVVSLLPANGAGVSYDSLGNLVSIASGNNLVFDPCFAVTVASGSVSEPVAGNWCTGAIAVPRIPVPTTLAYVDLIANSAGGSSSAYTSGLNALKIFSAAAGVFSNFTPCKSGQQFSASVAACGSSGAGDAVLEIVFYEANGTTVASGTTVTVAVTASWAVVYNNAVVAPSGASYVTFRCALNSGTIPIWINNAVLYGPVGGALAFDAYNNLIVQAGGALSISGGNLVISSGSLDIGYFASGNMPVQSGTASGISETGSVTNSSTALTCGSAPGAVGGWFVTGPGISPGTTVGSVSGVNVTLSQDANQTTSGTYYFVDLPTAGSGTSGSYPAGSWFFDLTNGQMYQNVGGNWHVYGDPGDIVAGKLAAGVIYAGAIAVQQLTAGTATFTGPVIFANSSGPQVEINSTDIILSQGGGFTSIDISSSALTITFGDLVVEASGSSCTIGSGGMVVSTTGGGSAVHTPSELAVSSLPSSNPGSGSKQLYYDPSDSNRVYFAV